MSPAHSADEKRGKTPRRQQASHHLLKTLKQYVLFTLPLVFLFATEFSQIKMTSTLNDLLAGHLMGQSAAPDTEQLLNLIAIGDLEARSILLDRYRARLAKMIAVRFDARLRRRLDPSDVVQETLTEAAAGLAEYAHHRPIAFYPWLRQLASKILLRLHERHILADRRSVKREASPIASFSEGSADKLAQTIAATDRSPADRLIVAERKAKIRAALLKLSEQDREILILRHLEELPNSQIAEILGIKIEAVRARHTRALDRLRRQVGDSSSSSPSK